MNHRYMAVARIAALGLVTSGCHHSLHSPRPLAKNEAQLGVHVGVFAADADSDLDDSLPAFIVTTRYGMGSGLELGLDVGTTGPVASAKFGFLDQEAPLQISAVASVGLAVWNVPAFGGGLLLGYTFGDVFTPYAGYRQAAVWYKELETLGNAIGGFDIRLGRSLGLLVEGNFGFEADRDDPLVHVSGGVTYTF